MHRDSNLRIVWVQTLSGTSRCLCLLNRRFCLVELIRVILLVSFDQSCKEMCFITEITKLPQWVVNTVPNAYNRE